jgi:thiamine-monophosphate kinase
VSEDRFLHRLFQRLPPRPEAVAIPAGDDCAAVRPEAGRLILLAVDQVIAGRHYVATGPGAAAPDLVGRKLLARNLSDIAAMGGTPRYALVACAVTPDLTADWLERVHDGILALARDWGVHLVGGDLATMPAGTVLSLTIVGDVAATHVVRRCGARPGDGLFATGQFGASFPTGHHLTFTPRCAEGRWLAENGYARAMIDVSDGLFRDAMRVAVASGVGVDLDLDRVPLRSPATDPLAAGGDGEDYELLVAVAPERESDLVAAWPFPEVPMTRIGEFSARTAPRMIGRDRGGMAINGRTGFDHFGGGSA